MAKQTKTLWGIVVVPTGDLALFDGRAPLFWRRSVASQVAAEHGFETYGPNPDVRIVKIELKPW